MTVRLLSLPMGATSGPNQFTPPGADLRALAAALSGISTDIAINQSGEGTSAEYPEAANIGSYVLNGGIYVDWSGWPMWYSSYTYQYPGSPYNEWGGVDQNRFFRFLGSIGVDTGYISTFLPGRQTYGNLETLNCSYTPYQRMAVSFFKFPQATGITPAIISPGVTSTCGVQGFQQGSTMYAYNVIGIKAGQGWYFYASANNAGGHVDAPTYATFINKVLGTSSGNSGTPQQQCQATGKVWYDNQCLSQAEYACIMSGKQWVNGQCVAPGHGGNVTLPKTSTNLPLIIGGGLAGIGVIVALTMLGGK